MFFRVTAILLISIEYLLAAENTTTVQLLQPPALSTSFGYTTTRETEATEVQNAANDVTENLLVVPITSHQLHQESLQNIEPKQNNYNLLRPRGKTKFIFENIVHASSNTEAPPRNQTINQDQRPNYSVDLQLGETQRHQLQLATVEKEEFIQSELHNLAKDIAETELNFEAGKTNSNPRPSSWKSFFSSIFPQGILNVFHLSVGGEPQKSRELQPPSVQVNRIINPNDTYQNRRVSTERSTLPITPPMIPPLPRAPPLSETPPSIPIVESMPTITPETLANEENKNGTVMTNKDVFDINSAAEVSELPFEAVIPMESRNVFHIHPLNCEDNCGEDSEDYVDQLSDMGDDNVVAFSREAPKNIFYPTLKPLPYGDFQTIRNTDIFYSGTGTQTSEEIIRENTKDFGQKIPYHPAKQLDDFQKEVEKQFDHNEVRIDSEAASRKFLKHFKGKFVRPQQTNSETQFPGQSSTFKGPNHFELISSTLRPEINFQSQPSPLKPESQLHTYIFSAGFNSNSENTELPKLEATGSLSKYTTFNEQPRNGKAADNTNNLQGPIVGEKPLNSKNVPLPYPDVKPENLLRAYLFTSNNNNNSVLNDGLKAGAVVSSWIAPNKNSDTKENVKIIPNQIKSGNRLNTNIYSAGPYAHEEPRIVENDNENNVQGQIKDEAFLKSNAAYEVYPPNLKPESLLHTYIFSKYDTNNSNNDSVSNAVSEGTPKPEAVVSTYSTPKPGQFGQGLSSFRPTQITYLCSNDQLKNGDCSYSTTPSPDNLFQQKDLIQIQKSLEQPVKHTKPYVYYNFPAGPAMLSKNPIRVEQPAEEDSLQSESFVIPESYQQRQQYLQDQQQQLNQQQEHFQQQQIQQYQQKLQYQQQQQYQQKQREQMQKQQVQLQQYQQKQQQQLKQYQQVQQQQRDQQQQQLQQQQQQHQQQLKQFQQVQQQQRDQQQLQKQQQQLQQYQQEQQTQRDQQQLLQMQNQQKDQQQENQKKYEKEEKLIRYNTVQVEKIVPKPYPVHIKEIVEKIVDRPVPVERIVEKQINVPYPVREVVEKIVDRPYPVEKIIDRPVHIPYPVQVDHFIDRPYAVRVPVAVAVPVPVHQYIDRPYPVEKIVEKPIHVPYPVDKVVEKIIEKHIPIEVERIVEKPVALPKKPAPKKHAKPSIEPYAYAAVDGYTNKSKTNLKEELLELVPPPVDQEDHDSYKTIPDDIEFILLDDYNRPVPLDHQGGYPWNNPEKRGAKNHNIKRSPEFRRNLRVEYGFRPPLIPSIEIGGEKGFI